MRPFFPFYGSKWNMARYYQEPVYNHVIEPFAGSAGYATFHNCATVSLFDLDPIIVGVWDYLMSTSPAEVLALPDLANVGDNVDDFAIPQEARWLIGFWLNRGSAAPKKSRTAYSARVDRAQLNWGQKAKERIASQLPLLAGWKVTLGSYDTAPNEKATWFIDPPYEDKGRYYRVKFSQFGELAAWCESREGQVMACEGPGATWLPFTPLGSFKTSLGHGKESVWYSTH